MAFENLKKGSFVAFRNVKQKDTHPDYRGEININGEIKEIVIWLKLDKNEDQFLSGSVNPLKVGTIKSGISTRDLSEIDEAKGI
ncbi:MAG TPA: hypothetical protein VMV77_06130 [Bacteroidales bacterium]|nr:hypothetical protein [Bacteroidales bacterium]